MVERADFDHHLDEADLARTRAEGINGWEKPNFSERGGKKKTALQEGLLQFQQATGINESKHIKDLDNVKSDAEIDSKESKMKKAATKWYMNKLKASGLFDSLDSREAGHMKMELEQSVDYFGSLDLAGGDYNMISTLTRLEKDLEPRRAFRKRLKKQSRFVKEEFFRQLGRLAFDGSKKELLDKIIDEIKEVEEAPSAVQYEFRKRQKNASMYKETGEIRDVVLKGFEKRTYRYTRDIMQNLDCFGGKTVKSPYGEIPEAALEFIEWFEEQPSFASMDDAQKKLPNIMKKRQKLYQKRDKILEGLDKKDAARLKKKTNLLRRHELEDYLPQLEKEVRHNGVLVAEYTCELMGAREHGVRLFQDSEISEKLRRFSLLEPELQKERMKWLKMDISDRAQVVRDYFKLPRYLRDDISFLARNAIDREKLLIDAQKEQQAESESPFGIAQGKDLENEDLRTFQENLKGIEGQKAIEDVLEDLDREGQTKAIKIQEATHNRIRRTAETAKLHEETQKENYLRDLRFWTKLSENVKDESDVNTERERAKYRFVEMAENAYDLGTVFTSGGNAHRLQTISDTELKNGNTKTLEKLNEAKYAEHVNIKREDGRDEYDPLNMIEKMSQQEMLKLVFLAINKLGRNHMGLSVNDTMMLQNSNNIKKDIYEEMVGKEFKHLKNEK